MDTFTNSLPGVGPGTTVQSRPLNEDVECAGPPLWMADDQDRASGWNVPEDPGVNFEQLAGAETVGRTGPKPAQGQPPTSESRPGVPPAINNVG